MTRHLLNIIVLALFLAMGQAQAAQQVVVAMTPESIDEAIQLAADEKAITIASSPTPRTNVIAMVYSSVIPMDDFDTSYLPVVGLPR